MQKLEIKLMDWKVAEEKLKDGQSNLLFSNQEQSLDGAIHGVIFPWWRDMRAFLLLDHLQIFAYILLTSNQMIFLVHFGINKHSQIFQTPNCTCPTGSCNFVSLWKIYLCLFIPNCPQNHVITYTNSNGSECQLRSPFTVKIWPLLSDIKF